MLNLEAWTHPLLQSGKGEGALSIADAAKILEAQQATLKGLRALYVQDVEDHGVYSPTTLKLRAMILTARRCVQVARSLLLQAVQSLADPRDLFDVPWPILRALLTGTWEREDLPREQGYENLNVPEAVVPCSPWIALAPPVVPALVRRQ